MKIIKMGIIPKEEKNVYKTTCPKCNCEFEYNDDDIKIFDHPCYEYKKYINCPCCKLSIDIK